MKLLSCALLVSGLLYANALTLKTISMKCGKGLKNCPSGYEQVWHGPTMMNSACYCERRETREEAEKRRQSERPERCQTAIDQCKQFDYKYSNRNTMDNNGCDTMVMECDPTEDVEDLCNYLKEKRTKWQCGPWILEPIEKAKKEKAAKAETEKKAAQAEAEKKANSAKAEQDKKTCAYAEDECYSRGRGFVNSSKKSHTCEEFVRTCPKDKVKLFCTKHQKPGGFTCNRSPAYKKRFN